MKLSILIPMYNAENFIKRCLDSLITQSIKNEDYEVIVCDDGSTDKSLEIVNRLSDKHNNIFIYSHKNQGVIITRNKLLKLAKGDYIYYVAPNSLDEILNFALNNKLDIIGFGALVTSNDSVSDYNNVSFNFDSIKIIDGAQFLKENKDLRIEIWWYLVRKEFLEDLGISFKAKGYDGDLGFTLSLFLKAKRVAYCPFSVYRYFQSSESTMRTKDIKHKRRIANYFLALIVDFTSIINELDSSTINYKDIIKSNFKSRRDTFTFFTIIKVIKAQFTLKTVKEKINALHEIGAYPMTDFAKANKNFKYKILANIFNQKISLYSAVRLYNILIKK